MDGFGKLHIIPIIRNTHANLDISSLAIGARLRVAIKKTIDFFHNYK